MLIVQGEKTQCALHRGEGTKGLETWLVPSKLRKSLSLFPQEVVVQSSQLNCVAQDSQVWHLGHLRVQARQHGIDHLALAPGRIGPEHGTPSKQVVKFFDNHPFAYYNVQAFYKPSPFATQRGVVAVGLASLCARALLQRQDGLYFAKVFF